MADGDSGEPREDEPTSPSAEPQAEFRMELRDRLPGGRAVIGVEQEGEFVWLASREHVTDQARDEFVEQLQRIVREGWWIQNWPGK